MNLVCLFLAALEVASQLYRDGGMEAAVLSSYRDQHDARDSRQHTHLLFHLRVTQLLQRGDFVAVALNYPDLNLLLVLPLACQTKQDEWVQADSCAIDASQRVLVELPQDLTRHSFSVSLEFANQLQVGSLQQRAVAINTFTSRMHLLDYNPVFGLIPWHPYQYMAPRLHVLSVTAEQASTPHALVTLRFRVEVNHPHAKLRLVLSAPWRFEQSAFHEVTPQVLEIAASDGELEVNGIRNPPSGQGTCWVYALTGSWGRDREAELVSFTIQEPPLVTSMRASQTFFHGHVHVVELTLSRQVEQVSVQGGAIVTGSLYTLGTFVRMRVRVDQVSEKVRLLLDGQVAEERKVQRSADGFLEKVYWGGQSKDRLVEVDDFEDGSLKVEVDLRDEVLDLAGQLEVRLEWVELRDDFDCNGRTFTVEGNTVVIEGPFVSGRQEVELRHVRFGAGSSENLRDYEVSVQMGHVAGHRLLMVEKTNALAELVVSQSRTMRDYFVVRLVATQPTPKVVSVYGIAQGVCSQQCEFVKGSAEHDDTYFLDWDRVHIHVDDTAAEWQLALLDYGDHNQYRVVVGEEVGEGQFRSVGYKALVTLTDPSRPRHSIQQKDNNYLEMYGYAGSLSTIDLHVESTPSHKLNDHSHFGAAIIVDTYWPIWQQGVSHMATSSLLDSPLSLHFDDRALLFIPYNHDYTLLTLQDVQYPYSYDLETYYIYISDRDGSLDSYKYQYNPGSDMFYPKVLSLFTFQCDDNTQGTKNSFCQLRFRSNYPIPANSQLVIALKNMNLYTNQVVLNQEPLDCQPNSSNDLIAITLPHSLPVDDYTLAFNGLAIKQDQLEYLIDFQLKDYSFIVEYHQRLFVTSSPNNLSILIYELFYEFVNSDVFSSSRMKFKIPRKLKSNEQFYLYLGSDLNDQNQHPERLIFQLFLLTEDQQYQEIPIFAVFDGKEYNIVVDQLDVGNYELRIQGIRIPAGNLNDLFQLKYVRDFDLGLTLTNSYDSTVEFPEIVDGYIGDISIVSGHRSMGGIVSTLILRFKKVELSQRTKIQVFFPFYYSPGLSSDDNLICRVNKQPIKCENDIPYRLVLFDTTLEISSNQQFDITIDGIDSPSQYQDFKETLFVAVIQDETLNTYDQYIHLAPPAIDAVPSDFKYIIVKNVAPQESITKGISDHRVDLILERTLPEDTLISILFPPEYTTIHLSQDLQVYEQNGEQIGTAILVGQWMQFNLKSSLKRGEYEWLIKNIPTPEREVDVDFNNLIVHCLHQDTLLSTSFSQLNIVPSRVSFKEEYKILSANDNIVFEVVRGTYSREIELYQSSRNRFISNVRIQGSGEGFTFIPDTMTMYIGDFSQKFRIGVDYQMIPQIYWFDIEVLTVSGPYIMAQLVDLEQRLLVSVLPGPIIIRVPSVMKLPQGGCTLPQLVTIEDSPINEVQLISFSAVVEFDLELSTDILNYTSEIKENYISYCSNHTDSVQLSLLGDLPYKLSHERIAIEVAEIPDTVPSLSVSVGRVSRTSVVIDTKANVAGCIYWELSTGAAAYDLKQLKLLFKYREYVIEPYYHYIGLHVQAESSSQFEIGKLMPQTAYRLCHWMINQHKTPAEEKVCVEFQTLEWQEFVKAEVVFSKSINLDQLNNLICSMVIKAQTRIANIVDSHGQICSLALKPKKLYMPQIDYGNQELTTNFYLIPDPDLESDEAVSIFQAELQKESLVAELNEMFNFDFIASLKYAFSFQYSDAMEKRNHLEIAEVKEKRFELFHTRYVSSILIRDLQLTKDGQVYFILQKVKSVRWDYLWLTKVYDQTSSSTAPTPAQIERCQSADSQPVTHCLKAVVTGASKVDIEFIELEKNSVYAIHYVVATEFPLRSVLGDTVYSQEFETDFTIAATLLLNAIFILYIN